MNESEKQSSPVKLKALQRIARPNLSYKIQPAAATRFLEFYVSVIHQSHQRERVKQTKLNTSTITRRLINLRQKDSYCGRSSCLSHINFQLFPSSQRISADTASNETCPVDYQRKPHMLLLCSLRCSSFWYCETITFRCCPIAH